MSEINNLAPLEGRDHHPVLLKIFTAVEIEKKMYIQPKPTSVYSNDNLNFSAFSGLGIS